MLLVVLESIKILVEIQAYRSLRVLNSLKKDNFKPPEIQFSECGPIIVSWNFKDCRSYMLSWNFFEIHRSAIATFNCFKYPLFSSSIVLFEYLLKSSIQTFSALGLLWSTEIPLKIREFWPLEILLWAFWGFSKFHTSGSHLFPWNSWNN